MTQDKTEMILTERDTCCETEQGNSLCTHKEMSPYRHTLSILMEQLRSSLGAGKEQLRSSLEYANSDITARCQRHYGSCPTRLRLVVIMLLTLMTFGATNALAQTDLSGIYYIASGGKGENNGAKTTYNYNSSDPTNNFYLCPTEGWCYFDSTELSENDFSGTDTGKPFLTTYKCRNGVNDASKAVWIIKKAPNSNYYYIIQSKTGKYLVANGIIRTTSGGWDRMRVHLEEVANPSDKGNNILFNINNYTSSGKTYKVIQPIGINEPKDGYHDGHNNHKWLTVSTGNYNNLVGNSDKKNGPKDFENTAGIVGIYTQNDANAPFYLEKLAAPTITYTNGTVTVTDNNGLPAGYNVRYTTDGSDPTASSDLLPAGGYVVLSPGTFKAVIERDGIVLTSIAEQVVEPNVQKPDFKLNADGSVTITVEEGNTIYYTLDGTDPTTSTPTYATTTVTLSASDLATATMIKAIAHKSSEGKTTSATTQTFATYTYKIVNLSHKVAMNYTIKEAVGSEEFREELLMAITPSTRRLMGMPIFMSPIRWIHR